MSLLLLNQQQVVTGTSQETRNIFGLNSNETLKQTKPVASVFYFIRCVKITMPIKFCSQNKLDNTLNASKILAKAL